MEVIQLIYSLSIFMEHFAILHNKCNLTQRLIEDICFTQQIRFQSKH